MSDLGVIGVDIVAKLTALDASLKQAESKAEQSSQKMNKSFASVGDLLGGARLLLSAQKLGGVVSAIGVASGLLSGNMEAVEQSLRRLPFGFGGVIGQVIDLHRMLSGSTEQLETQRAVAGDLASTLEKTNQLRLQAAGKTGDQIAIIANEERIADAREKIKQIEKDATRLTTPHGSTFQGNFYKGKPFAGIPSVEPTETQSQTIDDLRRLIAALQTQNEAIGTGKTNAGSAIVGDTPILQKIEMNTRQQVK